FILITVPLVCVVIGLATQAVTGERNVGLIKIELGSFATPDRPAPYPLAETEQVKVRLRQHSWDIRDEFPRSVLIKVLIEGDVVTVTGTDKGDERTKQYLSALVQREMDFQNDRLEKMKKVQAQRMATLQENLEKFIGQRNILEDMIKHTDVPVAMLALQQGIDNATARIGGIQKELDTYHVLNANDLFVDSTQIILEPRIVASSEWYRPLVAGAISLGIGLLLTLLIAIVAVIRSLSSAKNPEKEEQEKTAD
ncbi:hypothetical protein ACFL1S_04980, partial [Pseudomonadota bacterium]